MRHRQPLISGIGECGGDHHHRPGGHQRTTNGAANDLPLPPGQIDGESGGARRRRRGQKGAGEGENLEPSVEGDDSCGRGGLAEGDVGDNAAAAEDRHAAVAAVGEGGDALCYVTAAGDFQHVASERVGAFFGYDNRRLGLVLGAGRPATWPPTTASGLGTFMAYEVLVLVVSVVPADLFLRGVGVGVCVAVAAIGGSSIGVVIVLHQLLLSNHSHIPSPPPIRHVRLQPFILC
ncbi:hypothetical protein V8G54_021840 [Vigna mungo]|uniref:Uncharacterized protein n=1 Tax=Vigna mungo TaxID=3915 RepID=A0AAQ3RXR2_VIGMU